MILQFLPVVRYAAGVLFHGRIGGHTVEQFELFPILLYNFTTALLMTREHSSRHNEIRTSAECLRQISGAGASTVLIRN